MSKQRPSLEERLQNLQQGFFGKNRELKEADPIEPTPMSVPLERIRPYDRNPRQEPNEAYDRIKLSIASRGFTGSLPITRRPGEPDYMVAEGGNTVLQIVKEIYAETGDPRFQTIHCLFEPWISESETLIAHLIENDNRGQLIFVDRARAVRELRELLAHERGEPIGSRALAASLRERGYTLDHPVIAKMDYAIGTLFPVIPLALRAGLGIVQVERIRQIESILVAFLESWRQEAAVIENARQWFLDCLARHDSEHLSLALNAIQREIEAYVAELCGESNAKARADFALIEQTGKPGQDAPPPVPFTLPDRPASGKSGAEAAARAQSTSAQPTNGAAISERRAIDTVDTSAPDNVNEAFDVEQAPPNDEVQIALPSAPRPSTVTDKPVTQFELPQDVKSLRGRMWTLATQLAQHQGLGQCIYLCSKGCGFLVDLPETLLYAGEHPESAEEAQRVTLWWMLAALSDEWPYGMGQAPALEYLEEASIYPAIRAVAEGDERTATDILMPRVSFPPSLDLAARRLFAVLDDRDYARLIQLIDARRAIQAHCRRLGRQMVWEL